MYSYESLVGTRISGNNLEIDVYSYSKQKHVLRVKITKQGTSFVDDISTSDYSEFSNIMKYAYGVNMDNLVLVQRTIQPNPSLCSALISLQNKGSFLVSGLSDSEVSAFETLYGVKLRDLGIDEVSVLIDMYS